MTAGLALLATLGVATSTWMACLYMIVLGLGLGMVMQVLVLAVQNAVDYRYLGVATSGTTLFRSIGGTIGVSLFGAIFTATLTGNLAAALPAGELSTRRDGARRHPGATGHDPLALPRGLHRRAPPSVSTRRRDRSAGLCTHLVLEGSSLAPDASGPARRCSVDSGRTWCG